MTADPAFPVTWPDPGDAELTWELDDMHAPSPLAPLAGDYVADVLTSGCNPAFEFYGSPIRLRAVIVNGRYYLNEDLGVPADQVPALIDTLKAARREFIPRASAFWKDEALPRLRTIYAGLGAIDAAGLEGAALAEAWDAAWRDMADAWRIHFIVVGPAYRAAEDLADLYERLTPGAPAGEALRLIQAGNDVLQDVEVGLEGLASLAQANPPIEARLRRQPPPSLDELGTFDGGSAFVEVTRTFLATHGHLGQAFDDLALPSWREAPSNLLAELGQRLARSPGESIAEASNAARRARLLAEAAELADAVRARAALNPDDLAEFERLLAWAHQLGPLTEVHNYWIDRMGQATLRELSTRVGARLVSDGVIDRADDIFYLHRGEIAELLRSPADRRQLVANRRAEHRHQATLTAPAYIGKPPADYGFTSRFDNARSGEKTEALLMGIGASAGVARGPARVVLGPDDFGRVVGGDIIVCPSSNPSWVPVFTIAAGLVTNTGGVLAHAAVVAREFGLPAVVGTGEATTRITDGRQVEIDGTAGTVRLL